MLTERAQVKLNSETKNDATMTWKPCAQREASED